MQVPAFRLVRDFEVVALCGRRAVRVAAAAERLGLADTSTDWESFVRRPDLDLIAIATPPALHRPITLATIASGKHVLCEKPLAPNSRDAAEMTRAAEEAGIVTATGFELRWLPERLAILELMEASYLGERYFMRLSQSREIWHPAHAPLSSWVYDIDAGGGQLNASVSHDVDFVRAVFGEVDMVSAELRTTLSQRELADGSSVKVSGDDTGGLLLRMDGGALAIVTYTAVGCHARSTEIEMFGRAGSIEARTSGSSSLRGRPARRELLCGAVGDESLRAFQPSARQPRSSPELPKDKFSSMAIRALALMLEDWVPAFEGMPTRVPSFRDGLAVQLVLDAARLSAREGRWVDPKTLMP